MEDFIHLMAGFTVGALTIGSSTYRTIKVIDGKVGAVAVSSLLHSALYLTSINYVINKDMYGYVGFSLGAGLSTCYLAFRQKKE